MYEQHFNFSENPFTIAPNPRYLYLTDQHREALAHLAYGLNEENGGFILLTGEVGTGKTTVCRALLEQLPENTYLAMVLNPTLSEVELLETICDEFGVSYNKGGTIKALIDSLNAWLFQVYADGKRASVIIEEAQNLDTKVLEQLRLLTNLETNERKLLQIILIGQPELLSKLEQPELRQLSQRVVARYHLKPLGHNDVRAYIMHRLQKAGGYPGIFSPAVILRITQLSQGIPRLINLLCDRALLGCYAQDKYEVDMKTLVKAAGEVFGERKQISSFRRLRVVANRWLPVAAALVAVVAGSAYLSQSSWLAQLPNFWTSTEVSAAKQTVFPSQLEVVQADRVDRQAEAVSVDEVPLSAGVGSMRETSLEDRDASQPLTWQTLKANVPGEREAYQALFAGWKLDGFKLGSHTPCEFAQSQGLDCWHRQSEFSDIQRLNRPVILKLTDEQNKLFYVALLAISQTRWQLGAGEQTLEVSKRFIEEAWTGEYTLIWKRPPGYVRTVRPNDRSQLVGWLDMQLAKIQGRSVSQREGPLVYNAGLVASVRRFQRNCDLQVDGLLGRETIMMLNTINDKAPVLSVSRRKACSRKLNV